MGSGKADNHRRRNGCAGRRKLAVHTGRPCRATVRFSGTYTEIEPPERLVSTFEYDGMPDNVVLQILNLSEHNHKTHLTQILRYRTLEDLDRMYATGLEDGAKESMERLAVYLTHAHVLA